jgi:hypothetical protein
MRRGRDATFKEITSWQNAGGAVGDGSLSATRSQRTLILEAPHRWIAAASMALRLAQTKTVRIRIHRSDIKGSLLFPDDSEYNELNVWAVRRSRTLQTS